MGLNAEQVKVIRVKQDATAADKEYYVHLGWRPVFIWAINPKASGAMAMATDGVHADGKATLFGSNAEFSEASDAITFKEEGFVIGKNTSLFKDDDADIILACFRNMQEVPIIEIDSDTPARTVGYGEGEQFDKDATDLAEVGVYEHV